MEACQSCHATLDPEGRFCPTCGLPRDPGSALGLAPGEGQGLNDSVDFILAGPEAVSGHDRAISRLPHRFWTMVAMALVGAVVWWAIPSLTSDTGTAGPAGPLGATTDEGQTEPGRRRPVN